MDVGEDAWTRMRIRQVLSRAHREKILRRREMRRKEAWMASARSAFDSGLVDVVPWACQAGEMPVRRWALGSSSLCTRKLGSDVLSAMGGAA